nr:MFS transporter [Burkholderia sp. WAC0059]
MSNAPGEARALSSNSSAAIAASASGALPGCAAHARSPRFVLLTASAACALVVLDTNVVAVSLPAIARSFHASFASVEWVVSAYMVAFASSLLAAGGLADRVGRKRTLLIGLAVFALASLGCGLAPSIAALNLARAVKGFGAALFLTSALAVIAHTFQAGPERVKAWAFWGTCMGLATTAAPLVGGAITQWIGWRGIFLLNLPVCAVLAVCVSIGIGDSRNPHAGPIDVAGSVLFGGGLALGIWALIGAPAAGWTSAPTLLRFAGCALLVAGFVAVERVKARLGSHPMIDLALFRRPRFVAAVLAMFGYASCAQVMMTFLPLYLQNAFGFTAIAAGLGMLPFAIAMVVGPYVGSICSARLPGHAVLTLGLALIGAGNLATALAAGEARYAVVALGLVVTGIGAGVLNGDTQKAIMACVPAHRMGMASGISTTTRFTAIVTSVGVLGAVLAAQTHAGLTAAAAAGRLPAALLDARFLSSVLAGDTARAVSSMAASARPALAAAARASFAAGFSAALDVAGGFALAVALLVWTLSRLDERVETAWAGESTPASPTNPGDANATAGRR